MLATSGDGFLARRSASGGLLVAIGFLGSVGIYQRAFCFLRIPFWRWLYWSTVSEIIE